MIFLLLISDVMQLFSLSLTQNICASQPCTLQKKQKRVIVSISYIVYMFLCLTGLHNHLKPLAYD